jgi:hypothetical protein
MDKIVIIKIVGVCSYENFWKNKFIISASAYVIMLLNMLITYAQDCISRGVSGGIRNRKLPEPHKKLQYIN